MNDVGHYHTAFSQERSCITDDHNCSWMSRIPDDIQLSVISMPGTHDTMALHGGEQLQCQTMVLKEQLVSGIRALDIRCRHEYNQFTLHHSFVSQHATFGQVLDECVDFLVKYPTEVIVMRLKEEWYPRRNNRSFEETFDEYRHVYSQHFHIPPKSGNLPLGDIRGKIVILQNFVSERINYGVRFPERILLQDDFQIPTIWNLHDKWNKVKKHMLLANQTINSNKIQPKYFVNFLSGAVGAMPYFVASGHALWGTNSSRLYLGFVHSLGSKRYQDFPRISCLIKGYICTVLFEGTNVLTYEWLDKMSFYFVGIIYADFPGCGLIQKIIDLNQHWQQAYGK